MIDIFMFLTLVNVFIYLSLIIKHKFCMKFLTLIKQFEKSQNELDKKLDTKTFNFFEIKKKIDEQIIFQKKLRIFLIFIFILIGLNLIWFFIGLFTKHWFIFIILISYSIILNSIVKLLKTDKFNSKIILFQNIINLSFNILLLLNEYHLHLNFYELLFG